MLSDRGWARDSHGDAVSYFQLEYIHSSEDGQRASAAKTSETQDAELLCAVFGWIPSPISSICNTVLLVSAAVRYLESTVPKFRTTGLGQ